MHFLTILVAVGVAEVRAEQWVGLKALPLHDQRPVLLACLDTDQPESRGIVRRLNRIARSRTFRVLAVTDDDIERTRAFVSRTRAAFPVGASSDSFAEHAGGGTPSVRRFDTGAVAGTIVEAATLAELLPPVSITVEEVGQLADRGALLDIAMADYPKEQRMKAWRQLHAVLGESDPAEFVRIVDLAVDDEPNAWIRGRMRFDRARAAGENPQDNEPTELSKARAAYYAQPEAPKWVVHDVLFRWYDAMGIEDLRRLNERHLGSGHVDLLVRNVIISALMDREGCPGARALLMERLSHEQEREIRMGIAVALKQVCTVGDEEVAALLDRMALKEPFVLWTRTRMEDAAHKIRTGEGKSR